MAGSGVVWLCLVASGMGEERPDVIALRTVTNQTVIRVIAFAEKTDTIVNPLRWPQLCFLVADGAFVREGDRVAEFDAEDVEAGWEDLRLGHAEVEADLAQSLTELRNQEMKLRDDRDCLKDRLDVLLARRSRYRALPDPDEIRILDGKARVAEHEAAAASNDWVRAQERLARGFLSPIEVEQADRTRRIKAAAWKAAALRLAHARRPVSPLAMERLQREINSLECEIAELEHRIEEKARLIRIRQKGAEAQRALTERRVRDKAEERQQTCLRAPIAGHVLYSRSFRDQILRSGNKLWKNYPFLSIPDERTLAFKGELQESDRKFFQPGDRARLRILSGPDEWVDAHIVSISALSRDLTDHEDRPARSTRQKGVVVYDVVVKPLVLPDTLHVGMQAECVLISSLPIRGPSIPLAFVEEREGAFYLSLGGFYRKVSGRPIQGYLLLDDFSLTGRRVDRHGRFPDEQPERTTFSPPGIRVLGEVVPIDTTDITVDRIFGTPKILWLIDEDTPVQAGDVLARLDETEILEAIQDRESRLKDAQSALDALEERVRLRARESDLQLACETHRLRMAEIDRLLLEEERDEMALIEAEETAVVAAIRLEAVAAQYHRIASRHLASPLERRRFQREVTRARLQTEAADIRLALLRAGPTPLAMERARLAERTQAVKVDNLRQRVETDRIRNARELENARAAVRFAEAALTKAREQLRNHTVRAPRGGLVQHGRVWSGGSFRKVSTGIVASPGMVLLKIADVSRLHIRIEVPERHYLLVRKGLPVMVQIPSLADRSFPGVVRHVEFLFEPRRRKDTQPSLYAAWEPLGEAVFFAHVDVQVPADMDLKPGAVAHVWLPCDDPQTFSTAGGTHP